MNFRPKKKLRNVETEKKNIIIARKISFIICVEVIKKGKKKHL